MMMLRVEDPNTQPKPAPGNGSMYQERWNDIASMKRPFEVGYGR